MLSIYPLSLFSVNKTIASLKTLTHPPLTCDWHAMPYIRIYILYSIKLTRTHGYNISYDPMSSDQRLYFFTAYAFTYIPMIYVHWLSIKYTKYYIRLLWSYVCVFMSVYMHVRVKLTPKGPVNIFSCKYLNMIQFLSFKIVKWLEGCKTLLHNARDNFR